MRGYLLKIEKYLYYFFLFSIPFQTRKILWYESWRFSEWTSVSVYVTDALLAVLFLFWVGNELIERTPKLRIKGEKLRSAIKNFKFYEYSILAFIIISAASAYNSSDRFIALFQWLKLAEFVLFFFYLKNYAIYKFGFSNTLHAIFWSGLLQASVAIAQFAGQSDVGLRFLGESVFSLDFKGVASFYNIYGEKIIRAYGTMPHPNVLAGFLFLAVFSFYFIWFYKKPRYGALMFGGYLATVWGLFLTFSRVAIFLLGVNFVVRGLLLAFKFKKLKSKKVIKIIFYTGAAILLFLSIYWPDVISRGRISGQEEAVKVRSFYNQESIKMASWTGVGIGDFTNELRARKPNLPDYLYQPVHNIYLLIYAETGILGISAFLLFLVFLIRDFIFRTKVQRFHHYSLLLIFSSFMFMGLFDHFLWTLQQGRFIFWLVLAVMAVDENEDLQSVSVPHTAS